MKVIIHIVMPDGKPKLCCYNLGEVPSYYYVSEFNAMDCINNCKPDDVLPIKHRRYVLKKTLARGNETHAFYEYEREKTELKQNGWDSW